jgi:AcrR family transcriptional regulator
MRRTKAEAAETRESILAAAEQMFFEKGVAASTLEEIAAAAKVTRGAIYWHFKSKTDLFLDLYDSVRLPQLTMLDLQRAEEAGCDVLSVIEATACDWLRVVATDVPRQRMLTILARTNFTGELETVSTTMAQIYAHQMETLVAVLARADAVGKLSKKWTPQTAGLSLKWLVNGMCWEWLLHGQKFDLVTEGSEGIRRLTADFRRSEVNTHHL